MEKGRCWRSRMEMITVHRRWPALVPTAHSASRFESSVAWAFIIPPMKWPPTPLWLSTPVIFLATTITTQRHTETVLRVHRVDCRLLFSSAHISFSRNALRGALCYSTLPLWTLQFGRPFEAFNSAAAPPTSLDRAPITVSFFPRDVRALRCRCAFKFYTLSQSPSS